MSESGGGDGAWIGRGNSRWCVSGMDESLRMLLGSSPGINSRVVCVRRVFLSLPQWVRQTAPEDVQEGIVSIGREKKEKEVSWMAKTKKDRTRSKNDEGESAGVGGRDRNRREAER
jgi:hypothetical protein